MQESQLQFCTVFSFEDIHIDFVSFLSNSKSGVDIRVSLMGALVKQGFKGNKMELNNILY